MSQLGSADEAISVLIEDLERLFNLLLTVSLAHFARHHRKELREVDGAIPISIDLVDHVLQFRLRRILT